MKKFFSYSKKLIILLIACVTGMCSFLFSGCNELEDYLSAYPTEGNYTLLSGRGFGDASFLSLITNALKAKGINTLGSYSYMDYGYNYSDGTLYFYIKYYEQNTGEKLDFKSIQDKKYYTGYLNCKTRQVSFLNNYECTTTYDFSDIRVTTFGDYAVWFYESKKIEFLNINTRQISAFTIDERCESYSVFNEKFCITENGSNKTAYLYAFDSHLNFVERAFDFYGTLAFVTEDYYIYELSKYCGYDADYAAVDAHSFEQTDAETAQSLYAAEKLNSEAQKEEVWNEVKGEEYKYERSYEDVNDMLTFTRRSDGAKYVIKISDLAARSEVLAKSIEISGQSYYFSFPQFIDGECFIVCMGTRKIGINHPDTLVYTYDISTDEFSYVGCLGAYCDLLDAYRN